MKVRLPCLLPFPKSCALLLLGMVSITAGARPCPPLSILPGTIVSCELPSDNRIVHCLDDIADIPKGTIARYKCERDENFDVNFLKCRCRGKWSGLRNFNDFMGRCNISDYSIDGPQELKNLSSREIRQLFGADAQAPNPEDFQEDGVAYHNLYRKIHHSPPLRLNATLSARAQKWADELADQPALRTEDWSKRWYSQNLYRITNPNVDAKEAVRLAVAAWYQGAYRYNWENPSSQSAFTQVVWKSTTDIGFGVKKSGNRTLVVADYWPTGNIIVSNPAVPDKFAWFRVNVFPPNAVNDSITKTKGVTTMRMTTAMPSTTSSLVVTTGSSVEVMTTPSSTTNSSVATTGSGAEVTTMSSSSDNSSAVTTGSAGIMEVTTMPSSSINSSAVSTSAGTGSGAEITTTPLSQG